MPTESTFMLAAIFVAIAATGWLLGYFGERDEQPPLNVDYLKGLNFLLNEQTDQAVEHFLKMVRVDSTTIETHFALGTLFRKKGEVNRAIRIHQNIIARPDISDIQRNQAFYSLAKDYLHAGLLDRAEILFTRLADESEYKTESHTNLISIYEQEKDWKKAIETATKLNKLASDASLEHRVSHYICELAQEAISQEKYDTAADSLLKSVKEKSKKTLRLNLIFAEICVLKEDYSAASEIYYDILLENNYLVTESLPLLFDIYLRQNRLTELDKKLSSLLKKFPKIENIIAYTAIINDLTKSKVIDHCIENYIKSDTALSEFINVNEVYETNLNLKVNSINKIRQGLLALASSNPRYQCGECGFSSLKLLWQCPSCKNWETQRPFLSVKFDSLLQRKLIDNS